MPDEFERAKVPRPGECPICRAGAASGPSSLSLRTGIRWPMHSSARSAKWSGRGDLRRDRREAHLRRDVPPGARAGTLPRTDDRRRRIRGRALPPTVPAAVVNLALVLQGKIPVNLNYTAGQDDDRFGDRPVRDHARDHLAQGAREVPGHAPGQPDPARGRPGPAPRGPTSSPARPRRAGSSCVRCESLLARPGPAEPGRDRHGDLHLGLDGRPQGGGPLAPQHPEQRPADRAADPPAPRRGPAGHPAVLPLVRLHGHDLDGPRAWARRWSITSTRSTRGRSASSARSTR